MVIVLRLICIIVKKLFGWVCSFNICLVCLLFLLVICCKWILCVVVKEIFDIEKK